MIRPIAIAMLTLSLASCGVVSSIGNAIPVFGDGDGVRGQGADVDGLRFRSRISREGEDRRAFVATTRGADRNIPAALEAARIRALDYCLATVGGTDVDWSLSPDRATDSSALNEDGSVTVAGRCLTR